MEGHTNAGPGDRSLFIHSPTPVTTAVQRILQTFFLQKSNFKCTQYTYNTASGVNVCAYFVLYLSAIADLSAGSGMYFKCVVYSCGAIHNKMFTRRIEATLTRHPPFRNKFLKVMKINLGLKN